MKAESMKYNNDETNSFNKSVDLFFGMNPKNPYWILIVFYLSKERKLRVVEDCAVSEIRVLASMDRDYAEITYNDQSFQEQWIDKHVINRYLIADVEKDSELIHIKEVFSQYIESILEIKPIGIFNTKNWEPVFLFNVAENFINLSDKWYSNNYTESFDKLISRIHFKRGISMMMQPKELSRVVSNLLNYQGGIVYNPFAGLCSYGIELNAGTNYYAEEIDELTWAMAKLRMMVYGMNSSNFKRKDSLRWIAEPVDFIISTPPLGIISENLSKDKENYEAYYLRLAPKFASKRSIGVYPAGILSIQSAKAINIRKELIEIDILDTVVLLPKSVLFPYSDIQLCVILTNKEKKHKRFVKFVDASNCFIKGGRQYLINEKELLDLCFTNANNEKIKLVPNLEIKNENYSLDSARYFKKEIIVPDGFNLVYLSDLGHFYTNRSGRNGVGKLVSVKDLSDNAFNYTKTAADFAEGEYKESYAYIERDTLLISKIRYLKPNFFTAEHGCIYLHPNVLAFEVNLDKVTIPYLVNELSQDYVKEQLNYSYSIIPSFNISDLNRIQILLPQSKDQQNRRVETHQEVKAKELGIKYDRLKNAYFDEFKINMRLRKHAIQQELNKLSPAISILSPVIYNGKNIIRKDEIVAERSGKNFIQYWEIVEKSVNKVVSMVDSLVDQQTYGEPENFWVETFLEGYKEAHLSEGYTLELILNNEVNEEIPSNEYNQSDDNHIEVYAKKGERLDQHAISFNQNDLVQVIENIMSNAKKWGFVDEERRDYCVRFVVENSILNDKPAVSIKISNNGIPFQEGMNSEKLFRWGIGNGNGLGTWQVKNIIEHFGGQVIFNEFPHDPDGFQVEYELIIPTTNIF